MKLREWTGEKVYARLFDRPTTIRTDENWLFFNVEGLTSDPKLESSMSMIIANAMSERASGRSGQPNITVLDECWSLLDSAVLAPQVEQLFRTGRKRGASIWGISQALEDFVGTETQPRPHGPGIVKNVSTKIIGQQQGDLKLLGTYLHLNQTALNEVRGFSAPRKGRRLRPCWYWAKRPKPRRPSTSCRRRLSTGFAQRSNGNGCTGHGSWNRIGAWISFRRTRNSLRSFLWAWPTSRKCPRNSRVRLRPWPQPRWRGDRLWNS